MSRLFNRLNGQRGTSLLEVMIALVITGIVTAAILKAYVSQHKGYLIQEDVSDIQQNVRASIDELVRHCRMAGYDIPLGLPAIITANTDPDTITLTYRTGNCDTYLSSAMPQPSAELKCGTDVSCFYDGQWVYIFEPDSGIGEWFEITHVQADAKHIQHNTMVLSRKYGADALLLAMTQIKFFVDTTDSDHPNMMIQMAGQTPQVYAENISDLQFQYRMKNDQIVDETLLPGDIREVLISVSGRSREPDPDLDENPYRERTFATSVFLRNVGI
ncbi:MAG: prepilin-type N-terminal cleavage/methylation domain-containing protein [candidate division Zixibacteria bacterium]|nr:prepilin-type N-terminal cleavage/methylation domain-containing protein [candidate division Zixibacteria bacterium]